MIIAADTVQRILQILPPGSLESVTLGSRLTRETGYTSVSWVNAQRKPASDNEIMMLGAVFGQDWITFNLFQVSEATEPKLGDKITDSEGVVWQIKNIKRKMMQSIFKCTCLKNM